ncbi:MAG: peptidoglycan-binding protein [Reyranellales bacterium]
MGFALDRSLLGHFVRFALLAGTLGACQSPDSRPIDLPQMLSPVNAAAPSGTVEKAFLAPGGNYSMVTVRRRAEDPKDGDTTVVCAAPSPDWATAIAMAQQLSASGSITGKGSASIAGSNSFTETISAMAGRTAGVVALRDGLYNACQAYANGVIGKDAYALILSQYGNLLVALAGSSPASPGGGGGGGGGSGSQPASTPSGVAVAVSTGATGQSGSATGTTPAKDTGTPAATAGSAQVAQMQQQILQALLVACISGNDPTARPPGQRNDLLTPGVCEPLVKNIISAATALLTSTGGSPGGKPTAGKPQPDATILAVQKALNSQTCPGCGGLVADGIDGEKTKAAIIAFQKASGITPADGTLSPKTKENLGVSGAKP